MKRVDTISFDKQIYYRLGLWVSDINQVVLMLPPTKYIFFKSWHLSSAVKGWKRATVFSKIVLVNILR